MSNPSASWQRGWLDDGWLAGLVGLGDDRREPQHLLALAIMSRIASSRYLCCPGVSDLEQILLLLPSRQD